MNSTEGKHVFISYVREDKEAVDGLCSVLDAAQIPYWRDRNDLGPGDAWRAKIREAIRDDSLVFLACFSDASRARTKSYMNEELTVAVEEFRLRPPGHPWLIPVRFDEGDVPEWGLGGGLYMSDLNYCDLFGKHHTANAARLVTTIHRLMGERQLDAAATLAAVEQVSNEERVDKLKRLTKEMLPDPARRIELDDLISQEVQRVNSVLNDTERYLLDGGESENNRIVAIAETANDFWSLTAPFCASLQVAARWGRPDDLTPWATGLKSFVVSAQKSASGNSELLNLRHLPGVVSIMVAALACSANGKWENLKVLVADQTVRGKNQGNPISVLEATYPYMPFYGLDHVASAFARSAIEGEDYVEALKHFTNVGGKFHTPLAEWMFNVLRPIFVDQCPDDDTYASEFDKAEVILGVLGEDAAQVRANSESEGRSWARSQWFGRSTWRYVYSYGNPVIDLARELETQGTNWGPLQANLFGGSDERANAALDTYEKHFETISKLRR